MSKYHFSSLYSTSNINKILDNFISKFINNLLLINKNKSMFYRYKEFRVDLCERQFFLKKTVFIFITADYFQIKGSAFLNLNFD